MTSIPKLVPSSIILATGTLAWAFAGSGEWYGAVVLLLLGVLWLYGTYRGWRWTGALALLGSITMVVLGNILEFPTGLLLIGMLAALSAWDLEHFLHRCRRAERLEDEAGLERRHLQRLGIVISLGASLAVLALRVRLRFGFAIAVALALLAVLGLSRIIAFLRNA